MWRPPSGWRALPFKLQRYGGAYLMAQLPAVKAVLSGPQWQTFQQQVLQQHEAMEKQRTQPWAQMVPGLASTLQHLDSSVATLSATVQRTTLQQQEQRGAAAAESGGHGSAAPRQAQHSHRHPQDVQRQGGYCAGGVPGVLVSMSRLD